MGAGAYPARAGAGRAASAGAHAHARGRTRANTVWAASAETPATTAPVNASNTQWLAVTTTTIVTIGAYALQRSCTQSRRVIRIIGTDSISAKATCIEGTAAYGLKSAFTESDE